MLGDFIRNTSVGDFYKSITGSLSNFTSGGTSDSKESMHRIGWNDGFISPDISSKSNSDKFSEYGKFGRSYHVGKYTSGFGFFTNIKDRISGSKYYKAAKGSKLFDVGKKLWSAYSKGTEKRQAMTKAFPTAVDKTSLAAFDASSVTPGYGFAAKANRRDAFKNNQLSQAAIEAALANVKIQRIMLAAIKSTAPNIRLSDTKISVRKKRSA